MKKKIQIIFIVIFVIFLVFVFAYIIFFNKNGATRVETARPQPGNDQAKTVINNEYELLNPAPPAGSGLPEWCNNNSNNIDPWLREACVIFKAYAEKDPGYCLKTVHLKNECYNYAFRSNTDPGICAAIKEEKGDYYRDTCYRQVALNTGTTTACYLLNFEPTRRLCIRDVAVSTGNAGFCSQTGINVDYCYEDVAKAFHNYDLCAKINQPTYYDHHISYHKDRCLKAKALHAENESVCTEIETVDAAIPGPVE